MSDKDKEDKKQTGDSEYWQYLEETSKVVSNWPDWMRGESSASPQRCDSKDGTDNS